MHTSRLLTTLLATAALGGVAAGTASADSVAYIKNGDVWLTPGDASREFQVTSTGGYSAVSQADDGTLLATAGGDLRRLDRYGNVLSDIKTPVSDDPGTGLSVFYGPWNTDVSPDGKTAAYGYEHKGFDNDPIDGTIEATDRNGAGFTSSTALTGFTDPGYTYSQDWDAPEFIDNQTVLVSNGPGYPSDPIAIETVGSGDPQGWFTDPDNPHPYDATISRNKQLIAAVVGPGRLGLAVYRDQDNQLLGNVNKCFVYSDTGVKYESPTFNAGGTTLYWSDGKQLLIAPIGDMSTTCADGLAAKASIQGATSPDWGPADVPSSRPAAPTHPTQPTTPTTPTTPGQSTHPAVRATLKAIGRVTLRRSLTHGLSVPVAITGAGSVTVTARASHTTVAAGHARTHAAGTVTVHLRFTAKARHRFRHANRLALTLAVTTAGHTTSGHLTLGR